MHIIKMAMRSLKLCACTKAQAQVVRIKNSMHSVKLNNFTIFSFLFLFTTVVATVDVFVASWVVSAVKVLSLRTLFSMFTRQSSLGTIYIKWDEIKSICIKHTTMTRAQLHMIHGTIFIVFSITNLVDLVYPTKLPKYKWILFNC